MTGARIVVQILREEWADPSVALPDYATAGAAGADIRANLPAAERAGGVTLAPLQRALIPTGWRIALPAGQELQIRPRSGLALRHAVTVLNAPGTVDADYRGPVGVLLVNLGAEAYTVVHGARIAQGVIAAVLQGSFQPVTALPESVRGAGGFGSTGMH